VRECVKECGYGLCVCVCVIECALDRVRVCVPEREKEIVCARESVLDRGSESVVKRERERRESMYMYSLYSKFSLFSLSISLSHTRYLSQGILKGEVSLYR